MHKLHNETFLNLAKIYIRVLSLNVNKVGQTKIQVKEIPKSELEEGPFLHKFFPRHNHLFKKNKI